VHDKVYCGCGECSVDGGYSYIKIKSPNGAADFDYLCEYTFERTDRIFWACRIENGGAKDNRDKALDLWIECYTHGWIDQTESELLFSTFLTNWDVPRSFCREEKGKIDDIFIRIDAERLKNSILKRFG